MAAATATKRTATRPTFTMNDADFIAAAARDREARQQRAMAQYREYGLVPVEGGNRNSTYGYRLMTPSGVVVQIVDNRVLTLDGAPYGDQELLDAINARLEELGSEVRVIAKHIYVRRLLFAEQSEWDPDKGCYVGEGARL